MFFLMFLFFRCYYSCCFLCRLLLMFFYGFGDYLDLHVLSHSFPTRLFSDLRLTAMMLVVVSFVSLLVHVYTIGYMRDDPGYTRFFSYISDRKSTRLNSSH